MSTITFFAIFAFLFGLLIGSFLNVVIARLPEDRSIVYPGSHCPECGSNIRPQDNIPVLSWVLLKGKCRDCKTAISSLYPTIELLTGILAWLWFQHVFQTPADLHDVGNIAAFFVYFFFIASLIAQSFIDIRHYIIPDQLSIYAVPFAVGAMALLHHLGYHSISWKVSVLGAFFGGGILALVAGLWWIIRRSEGMGFGDIKLLALIGAMFGAWPALFFVIVVSSVSATIVVLLGLFWGRGFRVALPYGPFLGLASILWLLHGYELADYWLPDWDLLFPM